MNKKWWAQFLWVLAAVILGFLVSAVFAGIFQLPRRWFVAVYAFLVSLFLYRYVRWSGVNVWAQVQQRWYWGLVGAAVTGAFIVSNVLSQPASPVPQGLDLIFDLVWLGLVYGLLDALLLSVMPVFAVWQAFSALGWTDSWPKRLVVGGVAVVASLLVTVAYHWGYPEFRGEQIIAPVVGNGVMSLAYLLTTNPLAAVISHIAMHVSAVLHGLNTAVQLPPHY